MLVQTRPGSGDLHMWLLDDRGRDQFVIRYGDATEVFWNDAKSHGAELVYSRAFWTESFVQWSPLGYRTQTREMADIIYTYVFQKKKKKTLFHIPNQALLGDNASTRCRNLGRC